MVFIKSPDTSSLALSIQRCPGSNVFRDAVLSIPVSIICCFIGREKKKSRKKIELRSAILFLHVNKLYDGTDYRNNSPQCIFEYRVYNQNLECGFLSG